MKLLDRRDFSYQSSVNPSRPVTAIMPRIQPEQSDTHTHTHTNKEVERFMIGNTEHQRNI